MLTFLNVETEQVHPVVSQSLEERVERVALLGVGAPHVPGYAVHHHGQPLVVHVLQVLLDSSEHISSVKLDSVGTAL